MDARPSEPQTLVKIQQLDRIYRVGPEPVHAIRGIDLEIRAGELLAVVGVSGSGKSTLLQLLGGLDTPTGGTIEVEGSVLDTTDRTLHRRTRVGFVFQSFQLIPSMTALENVALALTFRGTFGPERERTAREALERVGLKDRLRHRPGQLSGGEQQRVAIARAVVNRPPLLLADEPTGNLDHGNAHEILGLLDEIRTQLGSTIVLVTHDEELAQRFATRIVRLRDGRLDRLEDLAPEVPS